MPRYKIKQFVEAGFSGRYEERIVELPEGEAPPEGAVEVQTVEVPASQDKTAAADAGETSRKRGG